MIAASLFAGIDGIERELDPGEPLAGDTYTLPEDGPGGPLPMSLSEALDALEADEVDPRGDRAPRSSTRSSP